MDSRHECMCRKYNSTLVLIKIHCNETVNTNFDFTLVNTYWLWFIYIGEYILTLCFHAFSSFLCLRFPGCLCSFSWFCNQMEPQSQVEPLQSHRYHPAPVLCFHVSFLHSNWQKIWVSIELITFLDLIHTL